MIVKKNDSLDSPHKTVNFGSIAHSHQVKMNTLANGIINDHKYTKCF